MITPRFSCTQTPESVVISIYCPAVRAADVEIDVDGTLVTVHIQPYFLRLNFSDPVVEDDASSAVYDPSSGYLTVTLTKEVTGQEFRDLDLLAKLLAPRSSAKPPVIEVLSSTESSRTEEDELVDLTNNLALDRQEILTAADNDWQMPQTLADSQAPLNISAQHPYGFLELYSGYFTHVTYTENEVNELGHDVETCPPRERRLKRVNHEDEKWDEQHYMADFADDEYIQELLLWKHPLVVDESPFQYTEKENVVMLRLPRKEYIPTETQTHDLYLTLITLLFSYAYESRTNQRDPTPESAWTLSILTPAFSALDPPNSKLSDRAAAKASPLVYTTEELHAAIIPSYRRSLAFPLYRSFLLAEACRQDTAAFLAKGKRTIVRCLLEMKDILDHHEVYYIYSKIWLDDFCVWTQAFLSDSILTHLSHQLAELRVEKASMEWRLEELEAVTRGLRTGQGDSDDESEEADAEEGFDEDSSDTSSLASSSGSEESDTAPVVPT